MRLDPFPVPYGFCGNDGVNGYDVLGLTEADGHPQPWLSIFVLPGWENQWFPSSGLWWMQPWMNSVNQAQLDENNAKNAAAWSARETGAKNIMRLHAPTAAHTKQMSYSHTGSPAGEAPDSGPVVFRVPGATSVHIPTVYTDKDDGPTVYTDWDDAPVVYTHDIPVVYTDKDTMSRLDKLQAILDAAGVVDPTFISDGTNALIYLGRGQWLNAAISGIAMVPYIGDAAKAGKYARKGVKAAEASTASRGGLNLFKKSHPTSTRTTGWREGDQFLRLPDRGTPKLNWKQNAGRLREAMREGKPIFETYVDEAGNLISTRGFLNAERDLLMSRGWTYNPALRAWLPPPR